MYSVQEKLKNLTERETILKAWERKLNQSEAVLRKTFGMAFSQIWSSEVTIFVITPTYARPVQKAELTRLSQTFLHVVNLHWIIVEDSDHKTELVTEFLSTCGIKNTHLNVMTPPHYKLEDTDPNWLKPRGVLQRNAAIKWLYSLPSQTKGVVYFGDDDNTYDLRLFEQVKCKSTWRLYTSAKAQQLHNFFSVIFLPLCDSVYSVYSNWSCVCLSLLLFTVSASISEN